MTRRIIRSSNSPDDTGSGNEFWNKLPFVRQPKASDGALPLLKDEAAKLRENLSAEIILPQDKRLAAAYARLAYEFTRDDFESHDLSPPAFDAEVFGGMDYIRSPEYRIFTLRYVGPELSAKSHRGIVEVKNGNLLGYHAQRTFRALSDRFFETVLREKQAGSSPAELYSGIVEPVRLQSTEDFDGRLDVFMYDQACDFTENPRSPKMRYSS